MKRKIEQEIDQLNIEIMKHSDDYNACCERMEQLRARGKKASDDYRLEINARHRAYAAIGRIQKKLERLQRELKHYK